MRADGAEPAETVVSVAGNRLPLAEFLADCLDPVGDAELLAARLTFLAGGLDALRSAGAPRWTQLGLGGVRAALYPELARCARSLLARGEVTDFFFMHKPPGLRVRFAAAQGRAAAVREQVRREADRWRREGLVAEVSPGLYEPEAHLFGGPASMRHVHRLFTVDSLAWLDHLAVAEGRAPNWVVSLLMLRSVFSGLEVAGWEDRDVWARVRDCAHRTLPGELTTGPTATACRELRARWRAPEELRAALPERAQEVLRAHDAAVRPVLADWRTEYFASERARVGPREAASYHVVFHWNRGRLTGGRQALIAEALAGSDD
ncbi:hypothetical protein GCM10010174_84190 [Kutzneria viridogrisea]|uniref:Thiopeptide-type bacteriocin biosynthesis protein n=1 Tax=Kutzneria viridogrisea TaxID=47990 RepID=A0ABR6BF51_9PSEU|nr:thiopeptide-type bacteriocin biosynthesis protein [Kutzneria viridogrisea]